MRHSTIDAAEVTAYSASLPTPVQRAFSDPAGVYTLDITRTSPEVPKWMVKPSDVPAKTKDYCLDTGEYHPGFHHAVIDMGVMFNKLLPTGRLLIAPSVTLSPRKDGTYRSTKSGAFTPMMTRPCRHGEHPVPTLLLSSNQNPEDAQRAMFGFVYKLIEDEVRFIEHFPVSIDEVARDCDRSCNPMLSDGLSKVVKGPAEDDAAFKKRLGRERRALVFTNMAMHSLGGCWDDIDDQEIDARRKVHDAFFRMILRGTIGQMIKEQWGPPLN
ncbi:hypothetical protein HFO65_36725 [Rhizobium laguerreae]|uniref:hypothetical protein n=1 Tax=Rhizobium laguerreae TaxID=1076926 RepID=UPI001C91A87F|nr:hypothetical protein [Rhizobium laguerreae]MBY3143974.1 hypothetical protein [Rhizobium laguerreae]MBY3166081.1 hypothetical protein [Rhizobium laguerreae]MBY3266986.1 hypothetical protein [Rhizobium laguerreae]MBY3342122.1 hypothetical protein [Rhizobium laguerreae]